MPTARPSVDRDVHADRIRRAMADYFLRQRLTVQQSGTRAASDLLDPQVWLAALVEVLFPLLRDISIQAGQSVAAALGALYNLGRTDPWLRAHSERVADSVTATTLTDLDTALTATDPTDAINRLFEQFITVRSEQIAVTSVTEMESWGAREAASQAAEHLGGAATKTWRTTSVRPRASHAAINGQTVAEDARFTNGLLWPGETGTPDEERANCRCVLEVGIRE